MQTILHAAALAPLSIPSPSWSGFDIPLPWGTLRIHAYALCILAGIIVGLWLTSVRWKRRGTPEGSLWDIAIWAIPFGIIGGRLYHVFSSPDPYFGPGFDGTGDLGLIPQIQRGGLGIWGAVVLGAVGAWIGCRRAGVKLTAFLDAAAPGLLLAQAIGRWGNWFNQELFGAPTTLPWGLQIDPSNPNFPAGTPADTLFHPTFLYESLWNLAGVALLLVLDRRFNFRRGRLFWLYAMYYTLGRVWIEALRIDDAELITFFGVTTRLNVWTSIFVFVAALAMFNVLARRGRPQPDTPYLPGKEPAQAEGDVISGAEDVEEDSNVEEDFAEGKTTGDDSSKMPTSTADHAPKHLGEGTGSATSKVTMDTVRDSDPAVSDSGSRGNLPDNQSGPGHVTGSSEAATEPGHGSKPDAESTAAGTSGNKAPGTASEAGGTK
ncbi:prolipoprotein diacylglyceryl transferase [Arthrobacter sp. ISL-30]|uniref:prolipoprotein diacylglyceryl transferase n=1 Tax=Arthrobacter sp. ISL-30 TaxID=2819109 RepID=UPI001BEC07FA|nr:prolipoprotein diacylglyceryl transferase [Arthrobacter sp. ISL-30]MBT2512185.1 prolipoprotein diacylglyceryl transferase [Arthrobacter sp. ISL-30]